MVGSVGRRSQVEVHMQGAGWETGLNMKFTKLFASTGMMHVELYYVEKHEIKCNKKKLKITCQYCEKEFNSN